MNSAIKPGTIINQRYQIQKILGQGGFGRTYLAFDTQRFGEHCVLKEFLPATTEIALLRKSRELFEREARVLYQISHHQIPKFLALLIEDERLFIVQEYIDGKNYAQILYERLTRKKKPFSEAEVKVWLLNMLPVLAFIHERQIIHRDISLENIMLPQKQSQPILIDFGVVKEKFTQIFAAHTPNQNPLVRGSVVGKIGYSPPEQLRLGECYPCSDIYALAVCALILLTGKMASLLMDNSFNWQWRSHVNISPSFASILEKMLAEKPSDRYQSAQDVITALNDGITTHNFPQQPAEQVTVIKPISVAVNQDFLDNCQRELTNFIGPLSSILIKHTLQRHPNIVAEEFIEVLIKSIPNHQVAQDFKKSLQISVISQAEKLPDSHQSHNSQILLANYPAISNPEFLENCRRELNSFVGPFGTLMLKDTLDQYPHLTPKQLIETLVAEIPNSQRAEEFRERILKIHN